MAACESMSVMVRESDTYIGYVRWKTNSQLNLAQVPVMSAVIKQCLLWRKQAHHDRGQFAYILVPLPSSIMCR